MFVTACYVVTTAVSRGRKIAVSIIKSTIWMRICHRAENETFFCSPQRIIRDEKNLLETDFKIVAKMIVL